jgi:hypothetical protein
MKNIVKILTTVAASCCFGLGVYAQQYIGTFPSIDGGYEGQIVGALSSTASSSTPSLAEWVRGGTSGSGNATINTSGARTGNQFITVVNTKNTVNTSPRSYLSPMAAIQTSTSYVIQFYCKASDGINFPNTTLQAGLSPATGTAALYSTFTPSGNPAVYTKNYVVVNSAAIAAANGFSAVKISSNTTNTGKSLDIDDWVVYPGTTVDEIAPLAPATASTANPSGTTMEINWDAVADVDGGGFVVIRYASDPNGQPEPNVNGIYKTGNTIGNGTVVYIGGSTSFIDIALSNNTTYYYRVYSVDKAFNYSSATITSGTTNTSVITIKYYIDAVAGNDNNNGSINTPWQNVSKLNLLSIAPGTEIYLKAGSIWTGQRLKFQGSGTPVAPIKVDKYGIGTTPLLAGNGLTGEAVVYLYNQQYIEINNLEITNSPNGPLNSDFFVGLYATTGTNPNPLGADRRGVMVALDNYGTANHIYLKNLNIHHIKGQLGSGSTSVNGAIPKRTGGIFFTVLGNTEQTASRSRFNDVLINGCNINYCENTGLAFDNEWNVYYPGGTEYADWYARRYSNVKVSNNNIHHIGKNAMIIRCTDETGLIEHNVCYETALGTTGNTMFTARAKGTIFQYNEGYLNRGTTQNIDPGTFDGSMYDPDFGSIGIIFQYSYSHDNSEGIYWGCNTSGSANNATGVPNVQDTGCVLRYCISQNDKGRIIYFNYPSAGNEIYNNVFYVKSGLSPYIIAENDGSNHTYNFYNNIIYNQSGSTDYSFGNGSGIQNRTILNNLFYGNHPNTEPADANKITANPLFMNPGSGIAGILYLDGYKLQAGSPALSNGRIINNNGGFDFYGTTLPATAPNRGVYEGSGISIVPVTLTSFTASKNGKAAKIQWSTVNQINVYKYEIQKSGDGINFNSFETLVLQSTATSGNYTVADNNTFAGKNYYRLKIVDHNGLNSFSEIKCIDFNDGINVTVFPNPAKDQISVMVNGNLSFMATIAGTNGQIVRKNIRLDAINNKIDITGLQEGIYIISVMDMKSGLTIGKSAFVKQ